MLGQYAAIAGSGRVERHISGNATQHALCIQWPYGASSMDIDADPSLRRPRLPLLLGPQGMVQAKC
jgi:hypothetical protein